MAWYETFFGERYLLEYAGVLTEDRTLAQVDALVEILALPEGARILDLCCGHGRHAVELASRGYDVCGQDLCAFFLEKAAEPARERGVSLDLRRGDMRTIVFEPGFDAVVNLFTAFGYFEDDLEDQRVLNEVARVLKPGGKFVLEIINRDGLMAVFREKDWQRLADGTLITMERCFDSVSGVNREQRRYLLPDGSVEEETVPCRLYTPTELVRMIRAAGLEIVRVQQGFHGGELTPRSTRTLILATKP